MKTNIGIEDKNRKEVVSILNTLLSGEYVLYTKTRNFHCNIIGPQFNDLHKFFESQYEELDGIVDDVAERARALGARAFGSLSEFLKASSIKERPGEVLDARGMLSQLLSDHEMIIRSLRVELKSCESYGDTGTSDFLTGLMEKHEKMAWMLRSFLEK